MVTESPIIKLNKNFSTSRVLLIDDNEENTNISEEKQKQIQECYDKIDKTADHLKVINTIYGEKVEDVLQLLDNVAGRRGFISDNVVDVTKYISDLIVNQGTNADNLESELGDKNIGYNTENIKTYLELKQEVVLGITQSVKYILDTISADQNTTLSDQRLEHVRIEVENLTRLSSDTILLIYEQVNNLQELEKVEEITPLESSTPVPIDSDELPIHTGQQVVVEQNPSSKLSDESPVAAPSSNKRKLEIDSDSDDVTSKKLKLDESFKHKSQVNSSEDGSLLVPSVEGKKAEENAEHDTSSGLPSRKRSYQEVSDNKSEGSDFPPHKRVKQDSSDVVNDSFDPSDYYDD